MSTSPSPQRPEGLTGRLKSFRNPTRAFTLTSPRPASPSTTGPGGRTTPSRSNTRDSSTPPPTTRTRSSMIPSAFQRRASASAAASKAGSSKAPSSEAVNELGAKTTEAPAAAATTAEPAPIEAPKEDTSADVSGHARALSGSTVETEPPMTPPPTQTTEPLSIPKSEDPVSDSPHDGASIASSRSPSRLRRQVSNLSRHSVSGSIRRLSLLGPSSPPQVETAPVHAQGEMQKSLSRSPSISSLRRHAASPEPTKAADSTSTPEPFSEPEVIQPAPQPAPEVEAAAPAPVAQPETIPEAPQETAPTETEAPKPEAQPEVQPAAVATPKEVTPAPSVKAPSSTAPSATAPSASKPAEPQTPVKPAMARSPSKSSLTRSPTPDKPEPKRRGTLANWARKSLDRRPSVSGSPGPSSLRPASRGPADDDSDTESVKERERKWGTGLPVPQPPTPKKKSEDNLKRRFSLGRRPTEPKSPNESSSEAEKKSNWGKMLRAVGKSKKEKGDGSSITPEASSVDVTSAPEPEPEPRPSLMIPDRVYNEQRPLSAIVESPIVSLNPHMLAGTAQSPAQMMGVPAPALSTDSPVVVKAETTSPEMSPVVLDLESDTSGMDSGAENRPGLDAIAAEIHPTTEAVVEEPEPVAEEVEQPKVDASAVEETPAIVEEVAAPEAETSTPPVAEATTTAAPAENLKSPMSPNSPASSPWDASVEREIARARSPRQSNGGPSNRPSSPAPSIIGVKRKHPDEPTAEVGKARVRYLPDWAVSPAIQLAVTLSLVLPRRKRDVANPSNRKRGGWWPLRRGTRTEMRYNAIRGVNEEVPLVSKSWAVPAAVRTTAKVVTAPARWMFHFFVPRSTQG